MEKAETSQKRNRSTTLSPPSGDVRKRGELKIRKISKLPKNGEALSDKPCLEYLLYFPAFAPLRPQNSANFRHEF
jgi:hypothetical protein